MTLDVLAQSSAVPALIPTNSRFFRSLSADTRALLESRGMVSPGSHLAPQEGQDAPGRDSGDPVEGARWEPGTRISPPLESRAVVVKNSPAKAESRTEGLLNPERAIYGHLVRLCKAHALMNGRKTTAVYVVHTSAELLMDVSGVKRTRFYEALNNLAVAGLVAHKGFTAKVATGAEGKRFVSSGTLFAVLTDPTSSQRPRLRFFDYQWMYRDMAQVLKAKTSVHNFRTQNEQTLETLELEMKYQILERYTLSGQLSLPTVTPSSVCSLPRKEFVFALDSGKFLRAQERGEWVQECADKLARLLQDRSVNLYRWILWKLIKASEQGLDLWPQVQRAILNVMGDQEHDVPTNYGAVLVRKLKVSGIWQELQYFR